jgi:hypothetical protein
MRILFALLVASVLAACVAAPEPVSYKPVKPYPGLGWAPAGTSSTPTE